jgi:hypothetical protein
VPVRGDRPFFSPPVSSQRPFLGPLPRLQLPAEFQLRFRSSLLPCAANFIDSLKLLATYLVQQYTFTKKTTSHYSSVVAWSWDRVRAWRLAPHLVGSRRPRSSSPFFILGICSDPPQLFSFVNRLGHDGNRPDILKYSVSVPNVPGNNYRDSFTVPDFSTPTLHTKYLGSQSLWKMKIMLGEHIRLTVFLRRQFAR